jgi:hypothetical protein
MLSGTELFASVDERERRAEREARAAQDEVEDLERRSDEARAAQAEALRALARLRAQALRDGGAAHRLDAADQRIRALFAQRREAIAAAQATLVQRREEEATARAERDRRVDALRTLEQAEEQAMQAARARAETDPEWQRLRDAAAEAERVAQHAARKAELAREDLALKGAPYLADPLFAYLWRRGFGTAAYRAGAITRRLDGWVARVAQYEPARRSYALLAALPDQLDAHAGRMRAKAGEGALALTARTRAIAGLPAEDATAEARDALERAELALDAAQATTALSEQALAQATGEADGDLREATQQLEAALSSESLASLRAHAARTPSREDDAIVAQLEAAAGERERLRRDLDRARADAGSAQRRLRELRSVRQEMRTRGYGRDRWDFKDGALIGVLVGELLRGGMSRDGFWDRMGRHRLPGGGPPGPWGSPPGPWGGGTPGPWSLPPGGARSGPWSSGSGGELSGEGGFKTGGRMEGGGGFRTGGSF